MCLAYICLYVSEDNLKKQQTLSPPLHTVVALVCDCDHDCEIKCVAPLVLMSVTSQSVSHTLNLLISVSLVRSGRWSACLTYLLV